jgi:hypothetical protein
MNKSLLRDPSKPISRIADVIEPYIDLIEKQFKPERVVIFGSYAYGDPGPDSDVDILVVAESPESPIKTGRRIRESWRPLRASAHIPCLDLIVENPEGHKQRIKSAAGFYDEINKKGIRVI